jgi:hypothetical protein
VQAVTTIGKAGITHFAGQLIASELIARPAFMLRPGSPL